MTNELMTNQLLTNNSMNQFSVVAKSNLGDFSPKPYTFNLPPYKIFHLLAIFTT